MVSPTPEQTKIRDLQALDLLVVAPAGCGKTEALALRMQGLLERGDVAYPKKILVLTFSNRARENIRERLTSYLSPVTMRDRVTVMNFHGLSARLIRAHGNVIGLSDELILPEDDWIGWQLRERRISYDDRGEIQRVFREIKQEKLDDSEIELALHRKGNATALKLERQRKKENRLTYDDLPRLAELILDYDSVADLYKMHFGAVVVDEFQDLTPQQLRIVNRIGYKRTTYAGDLAQGIYSFAGAKPQVIYNSIYKECSKIVRLSASHRSSPAVLSVVNALVELTSGEILIAADSGSWPSGGLKGCVCHDSVDEEAEWVLETARAIQVKAPNHRIGILSRTISRRRFIDELIAHKGINFYRWDDPVFDTDTAKIVRAMLGRFNVKAYRAAADKVAFLREEAGFEFINDTDTRRSLAEALDWVEDQLSNSERPGDIRKRISVGDSEDLLARSGVHLLNAHVGKGQQFDWVFVVGCEDGCIPDFRAKSDEALQEEARVLSVMISRARHGVVLNWSRSVPSKSGCARSTEASRFMKSINIAAPYTKTEIMEWIQGVNLSATVEG